MCPIQYYTIMLNCKDKKLLRMRMVWHFKEHKNLSLTARAFNTTRITVAKWVKRYEEAGYAGLESRSTKEKQTTLQITKTKVQHISKSVAMLPPIILDSMIKDIKNLDSEIEYLYKSVYNLLQILSSLTICS
ncbi:MAG: helix-turn-helix domain-containing protein [Bacteroidales bacterium]